jgi:hypothetical protein
LVCINVSSGQMRWCAWSVFSLPNCAPQLPDLRQKATRKRRERDEPFLGLDPFLAERHEKSAHAPLRPHPLRPESLEQERELEPESVDFETRRLPPWIA